MNKVLATLFMIMALPVLFGCTENTRAKSFGGTMKVDLPPHSKLINVTWKEGHLWYLVRPMQTNETAITYTFHENSSFGVLQGTVILKEVK
jgi:hypothetical protein